MNTKKLDLIEMAIKKHGCNIKVIGFTVVVGKKCIWYNTQDMSTHIQMAE